MIGMLQIRRQQRGGEDVGVAVQVEGARKGSSDSSKVEAEGHWMPCLAYRLSYPAKPHPAIRYEALIGQ
jgi:hypothetical protein